MGCQGLNSSCLCPVSRRERCQLFVFLLNRAARLGGLSRRKLARELGVSVGTMNNYLLHKVDPLCCRLVIQQRLAALNGLGVDELGRLYADGAWEQLLVRMPVC